MHLDPTSPEQKQCSPITWERRVSVRQSPLRGKVVRLKAPELEGGDLWQQEQTGHRRKAEGNGLEYFTPTTMAPCKELWCQRTEGLAAMPASLQNHKGWLGESPPPPVHEDGVGVVHPQPQICKMCSRGQVTYEKGPQQCGARRCGAATQPQLESR